MDELETTLETLSPAELELHAGHVDAALQLFAEMRDLAVRTGQHRRRFVALLRLTEVTTARKDLPASRAHATQLADAFGRLQDTDPVLVKRVFDALVLAATAQYFSEDFPAAAMLIRLAIRVMPDNYLGHHWLGNCEIAQRHAEAALASLDRAIELKPNHAGCHLTRAAALASLGRHEEAIQGVSRAVEVAPTDYRGYLGRSQYRMSARHFADAVEDLKKVIELSAAVPPTPIPEIPGPEQQTLTEYLSNIPPEERAENCRANLIRCYRALDRAAEAEEQIRYLIEHGSPPLKADAYCQLAELRPADPATRIRLYSEAIKLAQHPQDIRVRRATLCLRSGEVELALDDLEALARQRPHPSLDETHFIAGAVEYFLKQNPAQVRALKLRAFLYHHLKAFEEAIKDLDRAIDLAPDEADAYYWRALANLGGYHGGKVQELFFGTRIGRAVLDLCKAVQLSRGSDLTVGALKWVIDHTSAHRRFLEWWTTLIGTDVLPGLKPVLERVRSALELSGVGDWQGAVDRLIETQSALEALGLPVFANSLNVHVADAYIGLYQIPKALDRLDAIDPSLIRPLSPNFQQTAAPNASQLIDGKVVSREEPYELVQLLGLRFILPLAQIIRAAALHRIGNHSAALEALDPLQDLLKQIQIYPAEVRVRLEVRLLAILRDSGDAPQARAIMAALDHKDLPPELACRVLEAKGLMHVKRGELNQAVTVFKAAARRAGQLDQADRRMTSAYLAMAYLQLNEPNRALQILQKQLPSPAGEPFDVTVQFQHTLAQAYLATGDLASAARLLSQVADEIDRVRGRFRSWEDRMAWQTRFEHLWDQLVMAHIVRGERATAFNFCERARSRAFLDQLQAGHLTVPAIAQPLVEAVATLKARIALADGIDVAVTAAGPRGMPYELVAELRKLDPSAQIIERLEDGCDTIPQQRVREYRQSQEERMRNLLEQIEGQRNQAFEQIVGQPVKYGELRAFLADCEDT